MLTILHAISILFRCEYAQVLSKCSCRIIRALSLHFRLLEIIEFAFIKSICCFVNDDLDNFPYFFLVYFPCTVADVIVTVFIFSLVIPTAVVVVMEQARLLRRWVHGNDKKCPYPPPPTTVGRYCGCGGCPPYGGYNCGGGACSGTSSPVIISQVDTLHLFLKLLLLKEELLLLLLKKELLLLLLLLLLSLLFHLHHSLFLLFFFLLLSSSSNSQLLFFFLNLSLPSAA